MLRTRSWLLPLIVAAPLAWLGSSGETCITFKKPGGSVPPNLREPSDPAPEPTPSEPSDPPPSPTDPPPPTPGGTPPPTTPPPLTPPPPSAPPPITGEGPTRGKQTADDTTWETWWELNRIEFFPRRWVAPAVTDDTGRRPAGPPHLNADVVQTKLWPVLQKLVTAKEVFVHEAALITMGRVAATEAQRAEARETLIKTLSHKNHLVARAAALGLFYVADETSVRPMYTVASSEKTPDDVRAFLALTLTALKSPMAGELLKGLATNKDTPFELAAVAYMALGHNGTDNDPDVPEFLADTYKNHKLRPEHRAEAVESLGRLGRFESYKTLVHALTSDKEEHVRRSASIALGVIDYRTAAEREIAAIRAPYEAYVGVPITPADEAKIATLETAIPTQREAMADEVRKIVSALHEAMQKDSDTFVRRMATISIGRIAAQTPAPYAVKYLENMYKKAQQGQREFNLLAMGIAKAPQTFALATEALTGKNQEPTTRSAACITFGLLGDVKANDMLRKTAESDPHPYIRGYAALALGMLGGPGSGPAIQQVVKSSRSPITRAYAMLGMALLGTSQGADDIVAILKSDEVRDGFVASHMVYALGLTKDRRPSTFDALVTKAQDDSDMYVQAATIAAIGYLATGEFYPRRHLMARGFNYLMTLNLIESYFYKL